MLECTVVSGLLIDSFCRSYLSLSTTDPGRHLTDEMYLRTLREIDGEGGERGRECEGVRRRGDYTCLIRHL